MMPRPRAASPERLALAARLLAHADALHRLAWFLAGNGADAEDLVQEAYVHAFAALDRIEEGGDVRAWLFRILRNAFLSRLRRRGNDPVAGGLDTIAPSVEPPAGEALRGDAELEGMRGLVAEEIQAALLALGEEARTTILLDLEGFSEAEIARTLGCAQGTVKSRLWRAREALRAALADYAGRERR